MIVLSFSLPVLSPFFGNSAPHQPDHAEPAPLPDFVLPTADGQDIRLAERAASYSNVILVFHRGYDCQACRAQLAELQSGYKDLRIEGVEILAIGLDDQLNTQRLAQQMGLRFPMLYDKSGVVASTYGVREQLTIDLTTAFLILDRELKLITTPIGTVADQLVPVEAILDVIRTANGSGGTSGTAS
jgi:peroxiredoxin